MRYEYIKYCILLIFTIDWYFLILLYAFLVRYFEDILKDVHGRPAGVHHVHGRRAGVHHEHQSALASTSEGLLLAHPAAGTGHQQVDPVHHSAFGHSCSKLLYDLVA